MYVYITFLKFENIFTQHWFLDLVSVNFKYSFKQENANAIQLHRLIV